MKLIYFKQHCESGNDEWTVYGTYCDEAVTTDGDVCALVHGITNENRKDHLEYCEYREYIELEKVTEITREEFGAALAKLASVEDLYNKADEILKSLM